MQAETLGGMQMLMFMCNDDRFMAPLMREGVDVEW